MEAANGIAIEAEANLRRGELELAAREEGHRRVSEAYQELLAHYNSRADKANLNAINDELGRLSAESTKRLRSVKDQRAIVNHLRDEHSQAKDRLALAEKTAATAERDWAGLAAEFDRTNRMAS